MPDELGHAVGSERWELLNKQAGNEVGLHSEKNNVAKARVDY